MSQKVIDLVTSAEKLSSVVGARNAIEASAAKAKFQDELTLAWSSWTLRFETVAFTSELIPVGIVLIRRGESP